MPDNFTYQAETFVMNWLFYKSLKETAVWNVLPSFPISFSSYLQNFTTGFVFFK